MKGHKEFLKKFTGDVVRTGEKTWLEPETPLGSCPGSK